MTHEKARDFFSSYHEGNLEPGLRLSFEQKLSTDGVLRDEYDRFAATLEQLGSMREAEIDIPLDLNERIGARLDRHLWEQKQVAPKAWIARLRLVAFGGVAAVLLIGAAISIKNRDASADDRPIVAGPWSYSPNGAGSEQLSVVVTKDQLMVVFAPQSRKTVVFRMEPSTKPFAEVTVDKTAQMKRALENANPETDLVSIEVMDAPRVEPVLVAIPGARFENVKPGSGTLEEFAKALAAKYRVPVVLNGLKDPLAPVTWDLDAADARRAADAALKGQYSVDTREGNLVTISRG
jgi:hypothetical protein